MFLGNNVFRLGDFGILINVVTVCFPIFQDWQCQFPTVPLNYESRKEEDIVVFVSLKKKTKILSKDLDTIIV